MNITGTVFDVLIVGCGRIAGGFDEERAADAAPLTHAGAFARHGAFRLAACVEPDDRRREAFARRWDIPLAVADLHELGAAPGRFPVISICSPTALHARHLDAALALAPRVVFCEKPVTPSVAETRQLVERCEKAGVLLAVNHTRRWAPDVDRLAWQLKRGERGAVRAVSATYNKGVLNNGAHLFDLLHRLFGPLEVTAVGAPSYDHWPDDPTVPATLRTIDGITVQVNAAHAADYAVFELQLITETGVITMEDGGQAWRERGVIDSAGFKGYRALDAGVRRDGEYALAMGRAVANVHAALTSGAPLASTGGSALMAQMLCEQIKRRALAAWPQAVPARPEPRLGFEETTP